MGWPPNKARELPFVRVPASFDVALAFTKQNEGGWSNHENDAGGATKYGISRPVYTEWLRRVNPDRGPATIAEMRAITPAVAYLIYRTNYWQEVYAQLPQPIATAIFDIGVNLGPVTGRIMAVRAINNHGYQLNPDGRLTGAFVDAAWSVNASRYLGTLAGLLISRYQEIVHRNPTQAVFLRGWTNRAERIRALVV